MVAKTVVKKVEVEKLRQKIQSELQKVNRYERAAQHHRKQLNTLSKELKAKESVVTVKIGKDGFDIIGPPNAPFKLPSKAALESVMKRPTLVPPKLKPIPPRFIRAKPCMAGGDNLSVIKKEKADSTTFDPIAKNSEGKVKKSCNKIKPSWMSRNTFDKCKHISNVKARECIKCPGCDRKFGAKVIAKNGNLMPSFEYHIHCIEKCADYKSLGAIKTCGIKYVNFTINPLNAESQSKRLVRLLSELSVISFPYSVKDESKIKIKKFTDGLSNILVGVYHEDKPTEIVMVRIYGEAVTALVDRQNELDTMVLLSSAGLSNKLYAKFDNGCCYEYLNGKVLDTDLVRDEKVSKLIARAVAKLHTLKPTNKVPDESNLINTMKKFLNLIPDDLVIEPTFKEMAPSDPNNNQSKEVKGEVLITKDGLITKAQLAKEVSYVERSHLIRTEKDVVFCHNDLLPKNLILSENQRKVYIIDHEYASFNGRAFDVADHFLEMCGIDFEPSKYPTPTFIRQWIANYVTAIKRINVRNKMSYPVPDEVELYVKVQMYASICNLFWSIWALYMSSDSKVADFDYKDYAMKRLKDYYKRRSYLL